MNLKRTFDIISSMCVLILLSPVLLAISIIILFDSKGPVFYIQERIGMNGNGFNLFKYRTMYINSDKQGLLTVGGKDNRVTKIGYYLRKYKIDEIPQLFNVLLGQMSIVGPRPEVRKYVDMYTFDQKKVLSVRPGLTDFASLKFINENELLEQASNPEQYYIKEIMPIKLALNIKYINSISARTDFKIIFLTLLKIIRK